MTDLKRSLIGARNRAVGQCFEDYLTAACEFYYTQKIAWIEKTPEPMVPLAPYQNRKTGKFIACFKKQAQPDFKGSLKDGTTIIFDAKHTDQDKIRAGVVTDEQRKAFERYSEMGAKCYIVVSMKMQNFYRVPWNVWKSMKEKYRHLYMSENELEEYKVPFSRGIIHFLEGVELHDN